MGRETARLPALLAFTLLTGCGETARPDLMQLYARGMGAEQPPVIFIPGILGSRLSVRATGENVWPGSLGNLAFGSQSRLALRFDPKTLEVLDDGLVPDGIFEAALGQDYYGAIQRTLESHGGYRRARAGEDCNTSQPRYYVLDYDWRQDNVRTARRLDGLIERIRHDCGDPKLKVDIVAHSMGGLVTRYFLRYGDADVLDGNALKPTLHGAAKVRRAILLGTPDLGSVTSLHGFLTGHPIGFSSVPPEVLATMPSTYELFPHPLNVWLVKADGSELLRDLFDIDFWRRFEWSIFNPQLRQNMSESHGAAFERYFEKHLERARRFVWALSSRSPPMKTQMILFGGDCVPTPARLLTEEDNGDSVVRLYPKDVRHRVSGVNYEHLMLEPGDGLVTKASLLARENLNPSQPRHRDVDFPVAGAFFLCERHERLTGNISFQDNLLHALLSRDWP
ncbi:MAG: hypothetical protein AABY95_08915 [Pseudomonadota bacterium]